MLENIPMGLSCANSHRVGSDTSTRGVPGGHDYDHRKYAAFEVQSQ